jgi:segregation and condensation protein B
VNTRYGYDPETEQDEDGITLDEIINRRLNLPPGQTLKGRIQAVLFMTGKALKIADIAELVEAPTEDVEFALIELMGNFDAESALEIDDTDGYILQVKEEYSDIVHRMMPLEISPAELRTLSAIAIKAPVIQSDLITWRGAVAYDHIASLLEKKLITKRREGRSYQLNVTRSFYEYFKLTADKKALSMLVNLAGKEGDKGTSADDFDPIDPGDLSEAQFDADGNPL